MILIGENIHVISKIVREALIKRDENFVLDLINAQNKMDYIDLNVGPAKSDLVEVLPWLAKIIQDNSECGISFDTTNSEEMKKGLEEMCIRDRLSKVQDKVRLILLLCHRILLELFQLILANLMNPLQNMLSLNIL